MASSSPERWVTMHLDRLGLSSRFVALATRDHVDGRTKPDPASYRYAVDQIGAAAARSIAIEDSGPGVIAALAAGLIAVAVPSEITRHTDLSSAHHTVPSVTDLTLESLAALLP